MLWSALSLADLGSELSLLPTYCCCVKLSFQSPLRNPCQEDSLNWSEALCGFFESRVKALVPVRATLTQLSYIELRDLFFQVRSSEATAHFFGSRATLSERCDQRGGLGCRQAQTGLLPPMRLVTKLSTSAADSSRADPSPSATVYSEVCSSPGTIDGS